MTRGEYIYIYIERERGGDIQREREGGGHTERERERGTYRERERGDIHKEKERVKRVRVTTLRPLHSL